ncbi:MAG TPA: DUF1499 domain-containing protein [bacterium]
MSFKNEWTKNLYVTAPNDPDSFFHPRRYSKLKEEVVQTAKEVIVSLSRWEVVEYRENQGRLHVTRTTRLWRFVDDINLYIVQGGDGMTSLEMTSQSRVGRWDFGQNRRNLKEFLIHLDAKLSPLK